MNAQKTSGNNATLLEVTNFIVPSTGNVRIMPATSAESIARRMYAHWLNLKTLPSTFRKITTMIMLGKIIDPTTSAQICMIQIVVVICDSL
jgi:hypothetical protein